MAAQPPPGCFLDRLASKVELVPGRTAFALDPGSRDAALLVKLAPGAYSVRVAGIGNASGIALVEVYDLP